MAIDRTQVPAPVAPREAIQVDELGGEVIVQGLLLSQRLQMAAARQRLSVPRAGETDEEARERAPDAALGGPFEPHRERAAGDVICETLARCVLASDGEPLWSAAQWQVFGSTHVGAALALFNAAQRLNGFDIGAARGN